MSDVATAAKAGFARETHTIDGIETAVLTAGDGPPLVFFHGAGTFSGFDFALPWAERFKVYVPYHPGFGESGDDDRIDAMADYVLHYLDLLDRLGLDRFRLVGFSLGGWLAATFASMERERVERLALVAPAGLRDPDHPGPDIFRIPPEELPPMLVHDMKVLARFGSGAPTPEMMVRGYREQTATARVAWEHPTDRKLPRWLRRIDMPTLIVWGKEDRLLPAGQAEAWKRLLPHAEVKTFGPAGHLVLDERPEAVAAITAFMA
jgi:pimeloyl-ACP methyl ester carboxylesterase